MAGFGDNTFGYLKWGLFGDENVNVTNPNDTLWGGDSYGSNFWSGGGNLNADIGPVSITSEVNAGWGSDTWGYETWGISGLNVQLTGIEATFDIGTLGAAADANVYPTNLGPTFPFTAYGNAALSTTQAKFGVSSLYVTNTSGSAVQSDNAYNLGSYTNYTIEFWFYPQDITGFYTLFDGRNTFLNNAPAITQNAKTINFVYGTFTGIFASNVLTSANQWYHVAVTKNGSTYEMYVDGVSAGTYVNAGSLSAKLTLGSYNTRNSLNFNGYIDEFRLSTVRRYTTNFTPPTSAFVEDSDTEFLLHLDGANGSTTIESGDNTLIELTSAVGDVEAYVSFVGEVTGQPMTMVLSYDEEVVDVTGFELTANDGTAIGDANTIAEVSATSASTWNGNFAWGYGVWGNEQITTLAMSMQEGNTDPAPDVSLTGIAMAGFVGTLSLSGNANTGVLTNINWGEQSWGESTWGNGTYFDATGYAQAATMALGTAVGDANTIASISGQLMTMQEGEEGPISGNARVTPTGINLTFSVGTVYNLIWNEVNTGTTSTWTEVDTAA